MGRPDFPASLTEQRRGTAGLGEGRDEAGQARVFFFFLIYGRISFPAVVFSFPCGWSPPCGAGLVGTRAGERPAVPGEAPLQLCLGGPASWSLWGGRRVGAVGRPWLTFVFKDLT